jgi:hypothetical protein
MPPRLGRRAGGSLESHLRTSMRQRDGMLQQLHRSLVRRRHRSEHPRYRRTHKSLRAPSLPLAPTHVLLSAGLPDRHPLGLPAWLPRVAAARRGLSLRRHPPTRRTRSPPSSSPPTPRHRPSSPSPRSVDSRRGIDDGISGTIPTQIGLSPGLSAMCARLLHRSPLVSASTRAPLPSAPPPHSHTHPRDAPLTCWRVAWLGASRVCLGRRPTLILESYIGQNSISGTIPSVIGKLTKLSELCARLLLRTPLVSTPPHAPLPPPPKRTHPHEPSV